MVLTFSQIQSIAFGANHAEHTENGVEFFRMSENEAMCFHEANHYDGDFLKKTKATSGIFLDFYTDSEFFGFVYDNAKQASSRTWYYFEVLVDGKSVGLFGEDDYTNGRGEYRIELPEGKHRVTLFFPCLFRARLVSIELSDGASVTSAEKKGTWAFLGDSITQGYDSKHPAATYPSCIAMKMNVEIRNHGIGGAFFDKRTLSEAEKANAVFVAYGTNDFRHKNFDIFSRDCKEFFEKLATMYATKPIFVLLPIWRQGYENGGNAVDFLDCRNHIAEVASTHKNMCVIDTWGFLPEDLRCFSDGLHPNEKGFAYYADGIINALENINLGDIVL